MSGALLETLSPLQVVAAFHGFAIALCAGLLLWLVGRGAAPDRGEEDTADRDKPTVTEGSG